MLQAGLCPLSYNALFITNTLLLNRLYSYYVAQNKVSQDPNVHIDLGGTGLIRDISEDAVSCRKTCFN